MRCLAPCGSHLRLPITRHFDASKFVDVIRLDGSRQVGLLSPSRLLIDNTPKRCFASSSSSGAPSESFPRRFLRKFLVLSGTVAWGFLAYQACYYDILVDQLVEESLHEQQQLEYYGLWKRASKMGAEMMSQEDIDEEIGAKEFALHGVMGKLQRHKGLQVLCTDSGRG